MKPRGCFSVVVALVGLGVMSACTLELKMRSFQQSYEPKPSGQAEADSLALAQQLLVAGVADAAVLDALIARGLERPEAARILTLAQLAIPKVGGIR